MGQLLVFDHGSDSHGMKTHYPQAVEGCQSEWVCRAVGGWRPKAASTSGHGARHGKNLQPLPGERPASRVPPGEVSSSRFCRLPGVLLPDSSNSDCLPRTAAASPNGLVSFRRPLRRANQFDYRNASPALQRNHLALLVMFDLEDHLALFILVLNLGHLAAKLLAVECDDFRQWIGCLVFAGPDLNLSFIADADVYGSRVIFLDGCRTGINGQPQF